ncbi:MAG: DUF4230 domain-containing protein [Treponema sp.]|nr:DUF4230 domain-containing protein [Treponema sp.]
MLIVIISILLMAVGSLLKNRGPLAAFPEIVSEKSDISAHTVIKEVLPIGEYATLAYHYTSVVKDVNTKDIRGWNIPFTTRKYIFTYDGAIKLGIDGSRIQVEGAGAGEPPEAGGEKAPGAASPGSAGGEHPGAESPAGRPVIRVIFPPIIILSHEIYEDSIEVFEQSQTIFNEIKLEEAFKVTADRKRELEEKVMAGGAVKEAQASAEQQFGLLLGNLPGIRGIYDIAFVWRDSAE